ncbi:hypothetical protein J7E62_12345 [Variovorax paradoxus]|nr:hypothetical protein [Variovorax paradoxus]
MQSQQVTRHEAGYCDSGAAVALVGWACELRSPGSNSGLQFDAWTQRRGSRLARGAILEHRAQRIEYEPLIPALEQLDGAHGLGGGVAFHHARGHGVAVRINAERFNSELGQVRVAVLPILGLRYLPFPAVAIA